MNTKTALLGILCLALASCTLLTKRETPPTEPPPTPENKLISEQEFDFDDSYYKISGDVLFKESLHVPSNIHSCKITLTVTNDSKTDYSEGWVSITLVTPDNATFRFTDAHINKLFPIYDTHKYLLLDEEGTCPKVASINTYLMARKVKPEPEPPAQ